jgi:acetyl-CoA synthetase
VNIEEYDLSSVREYVTGGEAMPREIIEAFKMRTGFDIREGFGQTETALLTANYTYTKNLSDGIGYASPLYDMIVVDEEDNELLAGEVGEIAIRFKGDGMIPIGIFYTYLADEERYRTVTRHGIYHTGDKGYRDASGGFHFKSRNDDVIKTSGYRVGPTEVEDVIIRHEAVGEVAVTGFPDIKRGQAIKASIILKDGYVDDGKLAGEIRECVRVHAASYKIPRIIEFVAELPRTATGKVNRAAIRMRDCNKTITGTR